MAQEKDKNKLAKLPKVSGKFSTKGPAEIAESVPAEPVSFADRKASMKDAFEAVAKLSFLVPTITTPDDTRIEDVRALLRGALESLAGV